ncbi:lipocalin family protein [Reichenbachiella versicolor]|uniref:lipocalin family protein n=1 Tax=Reichenbachiella versicolor TaxID=1821036 RepID=UPI000D6E3AA5|nr:lipocalin family protein [Reichenbachiella versicolor]
MKRNLILLLAVSLFQLACSKTELGTFKLPTNAKFLLTGDSSKTWKLARRFNNKTRINMGDCFLSHRETYKSDMTMHDNSGDHRDCGETIYADWKFIKDQKGYFYIKWTSKRLPSIMNIEEEHKYFKILRLSEEQLTVQFEHEQFSNKSTLITDIYVPEHLPIKDREFHW